MEESAAFDLDAMDDLEDEVGGTNGPEAPAGQSPVAEPPDTLTDGSPLAVAFMEHLAGDRVDCRYQPSNKNEPPMDVSVYVCRNGTFVYRDNSGQGACVSYLSARPQALIVPEHRAVEVGRSHAAVEEP